ncbi:blue copper protein [Trifolium repens]|nr:blue copper protein [Trifolium repens]
MARNIYAALVIVANLIHESVATTYIVGDTIGWTIPPNNDSQFYVNWASDKTFTIGDTLVFNYETGKHRVENVTKSGFDRCNIGTIPLLLFTNSTERVILDQTGQQYFICTIAGHCSAGQKLSINVVNASTSPVSAPQPTELIPPHFEALVQVEFLVCLD